MIKSSPQYRFFSVQWKLLIVILLLICTIVGVFVTLGHRQLMQQQQQELQLQKLTLQTTLSLAKDKTSEQASNIAQQLLFLFQLQPQQSNVDMFNLFLIKHWSDLKSRWNLSSLGLYNSEGILINAIGEQQSYSNKNSQITFLNPESQWQNDSITNHTICYDDCLFLTAIPISLEQNKFILVVEIELLSMLAHFPKTSRLNFAVLDEYQTHNKSKSVVWDRKFFGFTENQQLPILQQAATNMNWQQINQLQPNEKLNQRDPWLIEVFPLSHLPNSPTLLVIKNVQHLKQVLTTFEQSIPWFLLATICLSTIFIIAISWLPFRRLKELARLIPHLSNREFDSVKSEIAPINSTFINEFDLVEQATLNLTHALEHRQQQMDIQIFELERQSMLDSLTGLPNNAMMKHELNKEIACVGRVHNQIALFFMDLDEFRRVNDTWGYVEGDELLQNVAKRLTENIRAVDTVFRYGGDEFLILLRGISDEDVVRHMVHKIFKALQEPIVLTNHKLVVTTSIGVALCDTPNLTADDLIKHAELAMYHGKKAGRSNYRMFNYDMLAQANNRMMIEQDISVAISENQLSLYLQPIIELSTGKLRGFEALIRWHHPELGLIMPGNFIPEIEDSDATIDVGNFVINTGLNIIKRMQAIGWNDLYLSVNISAKHWLAPGLTELISNSLTQYDVSPSSLVLELTEESVIAIDQIDQAREVFQSLKALGVKVAIDDFGTGYSSLNYLKNLPFDIVKIDRSFTKGVKENSVDPHIVNTMVDLAHNLELRVIAEGIETEEQAEFMKNAGCELCQGFLYSKPITEEEVSDIILQIKETNIWPKN